VPEEFRSTIGCMVEHECCTCPIGTDCWNKGHVITLETLPVRPGFYRLPNSIDVRRCPDAAANCPNGESSCSNSTSACLGGTDASRLCRSEGNITGVLCRLCVDERTMYFVEAQNDEPARCDLCSGGAFAPLWLFLLFALLVVVAVVLLRRHEPLLARVQEVRDLAVQVYSLPTKAKILIAFYMIAAKIGRVYEVFLPSGVRSFLKTADFVASVGFDAIPFACIGASGYLSQLLLCIWTPFFVVGTGVSVLAIRMWARESFTLTRLFQDSAPILRRVTFIAYPIVTNVAFAAFSCFQFEDGRGWLIADVSIECYTSAHDAIKAWAVLAILAYPIGLFVLNGTLLYCARAAIQTSTPTPLSAAVVFLFREYNVSYFWWELMEMGRRFLLVGLFIVVPFPQGTIMQCALAVFVAIIYLLFQVQAMPFQRTDDNYLALCASVSIVALLLCTTFFKFATFTELPDVQALMSLEQQVDFRVDDLLVMGIFVGCTFGALLFSLLLVLINMKAERQKRALAEQAASMRRLRLVDDGTVVCLPPAAGGGFHIFLSHVWGSGQDQMRVVKQRLREMLPGASVFLDVDDLEDISDLEGYVDRSSVVLISCSPGYFESKNCMREIRCAVSKGKPLIALLEEPGRGGASVEGVRAQLEVAEANYSKWGFEHDDGPRGAALADALLSRAPIEWNRLGVFQDVTLRLIAERLLPGDHGPTYVEGEAAHQQQNTVIRARARGVQDASPGVRVYISPLNPGAQELLDELRGTQLVAVVAISEVCELGTCDHMLLALNGKTWTRDDESALLAHEIVLAMRAGTNVLCVHEMPGLEQPSERHPVEFATFFACESGATPAHLLKAGIYGSIAVPFKGGQWRKASFVLLAKALKAPLPRVPVSVLEPGERQRQPYAGEKDDVAALADGGYEQPAKERTSKRLLDADGGGSSSGRGSVAMRRALSSLASAFDGVTWLWRGQQRGRKEPLSELLPDGGLHEVEHGTMSPAASRSPASVRMNPHERRASSLLVSHQV
jgi:hypothetical protein